MVNVSRVLPTGNTLLRALSWAVTQHPHVHSTDLKGVLPVGQISIALYPIETEIILPEISVENRCLSVLHVALLSSKHLEPESKCVL